jgi:hypothetical protein
MLSAFLRPGKRIVVATKLLAHLPWPCPCDCLWGGPDFSLGIQNQPQSGFRSAEGRSEATDIAVAVVCSNPQIPPQSFERTKSRWFPCPTKKLSSPQICGKLHKPHITKAMFCPESWRISSTKTNKIETEIKKPRPPPGLSYLKPDQTITHLERLF